MISILDPTSLVGRELTVSLAERHPDLRQRYYHTGGREEHLITEVAGEASIVPWLDDFDDLLGSTVVVVTVAPEERTALQLLAWLRANPAVALLDLSQPGIAGDIAQTVLDAAPILLPSPPWLHAADPALVGPARALRALAALEPQSATVVASRPVSVFGEEALHELASQAAARLSGSVPGRPALLPGVLAFDLAPAPPEMRFAVEQQFARLFPDVEIVVQLLDAGVFHGHTATLAIRCQKATDEAGVRRLLRAVPGIALARAGSRLELGDVSRLDGVLCGDVRVTGNAVALWLAADGTQLAATEDAVEVVAGISVRPS